jgi:hypothetical protein
VNATTIAPREQNDAALPLNRAVLCLNCSTVYHVSQGQCPACASRMLMPLATWLERAKP